jgi:hypothetical protein
MAVLAALIAAYHDADAPESGLRATLPLAGRTLVERQARIAASAGASPIILYVERLPVELVTAVERLRGEGIPVTVARSAAEAADAIHPDDRLLLIADGVIADEAHIALLLTGGSNALLTVPDQGVSEHFERIDAQSRWGGLALVSGQFLKQTAQMIQDWDLQSTLLRRAVQAGARQFSTRSGEDKGYVAIAATKADLVDVEQKIIEGAAARRDGWVSRYLLAPAEQAATKLLLPTRVMPDWLHIASVLMTGFAVYLFVGGWLWTGGILLLLSTPLDDIGDRLATLRMQVRRENSWSKYLLPAFSAAALLALGYALSWINGWGCLVLAVAILAFEGALWLETEDREIEGKIFLAERKGMIWLMLPFAVTGNWLSGLLALAVYACGSFFWAQRQVHRTHAVQD